MKIKVNESIKLKHFEKINSENQVKLQIYKDIII